MYYIYLFALLSAYTLIFFRPSILPYNEAFQYVSMALYITMSVWYFLRNRKESLFCPEIIILFLVFLITFYDVIVLNQIEFIKAYFLQFSEEIGRKSTCLTFIGYCVFLLGEEVAKLNYNRKKYLMQHGFSNVPVESALFMHRLSLMAVVAVFVTGQYISFMKYTLGEGKNMNMINVMISILIMVSTVLEFLRLHKKNHSTKRTPFFLQINKTYLFTVIVWSLFLLLTGNRGDMMLIVFPPIILFSFLVKRIKNLMVLVGAALGAFIMVFIGFTRQGDSSFTGTAKELGFFGYFRDYGSAYVAQQGLIQYTDVHGTYGYSAGFSAIVSTVPLLGNFLYGEQDKKSSEGKSNRLATEQFSLTQNTEGGMGTNLLGDLYYAGGLLFVIFYMFVLGWFLSYAYERLFYGNRLNIFSLFTYCWLFADSLYLIRAPYFHLFRQIGFSLLIYFVLYILSYSSVSNYKKPNYNSLEHTK